MYVKSVTHGKKATGNSHLPLQFASAQWSYTDFQLIVLVFWHAALPFWFTLTALTVMQSISRWLAGEFSSDLAARAGYLPQKLVETKNRAKREWILDLHSPGGQVANTTPNE